jgi:molybdopterin-guanine dinucleotide biosynthesis protein
VTRPTIVAVCGFGSNTGKTTLVCELLRRLGGWEAIKMTRGHYRSCGREPSACCVSPLLGAEPRVLSGRAETYAPGKDTGRYWDAGAANVHWVISTDAQVEEGFRRALSRVRASGVVVEGNSFLNYAEADFAVMVARPDGAKIKPTARRVLPRMSALFVSQEGEGLDPASLENFLRDLRGLEGVPASAQVYTRESLAPLVARIGAAAAGASAVQR